MAFRPRLKFSSPPGDTSRPSRFRGLTSALTAPSAKLRRFTSPHSWQLFEGLFFIAC